MTEDAAGRYEFHINLDANCLVVRFFGEIEGALFYAQFVEITSHPDYYDGLRRIFDFRGCILTISGSDMRNLVGKIQTDRPSPAPYKAAVIVDSLLMHGLVRTYIGLLTVPDSSYKLFNAKNGPVLGEAVDWLGLSDDFTPPAFLLN